MSEHENSQELQDENALRKKRMEARESRVRKSRKRPGEGKYPADMRPAGFWIRWGARFIDGVVFRVVFSLLELLGTPNGALISYFSYRFFPKNQCSVFTQIKVIQLTGFRETQTIKQIFI